MATANFIVPDMDALGKSQALHTPSGAQTLLTAAHLMAPPSVGFAEAIDILDVSTFGGIRIELWGAAADTNAVEVDCYGWPEAGAGHHIGQIGAIHSVFAQVFNEALGYHASVVKAFPAGTMYRGCDTYTEEDDQGVALSIPVTEANFPGYCNVDFTNSQYKWFSIVPTTVGGTTLGATFTVLSLKTGYVSPQFTG